MPFDCRVPRQGAPKLQSSLAQHDGKAQVRTQVAPPHAARLLNQPVQPFETDALHPDRRTGDLARHDIEGTAHAHDEIDAKRVFPSVDEVFLQWRRDRHEQQLCAGRPDLCDHFLLVGPEVAIVVSGEAQSGIGGTAHLRRALDDLASRTEEIDREVSPACHAQQLMKQVDARHPFGYVMA